eukprot:TRINITY_DN2838_c0_g2_i1.p1 TRINITY_DN2838_c0_g2~~TRINITY_DN2838_c0_g2_i1.p1  ORF type:complete len:314 (-),score=49.47 TRINITY_DN2838_c0_g2_i1:367-1233(-)
MRAGIYVLLALLGVGFVQCMIVESMAPESKFSFISKAVGSDYCVAYCDGDMVWSYTNNCEGVFYAECKIEGMEIITSCVGTWNETISSQNRVEVRCVGLFSSNVDGSTPTGESFKQRSSCGGSVDYVYYISSPKSVIPSSPVNITCDGTYAQQSGLVKSDVVDIEDGGYVPPPPGYTCTYMCGDIPSNATICKEDIFKLHCDVNKQGKKSTLDYTCDGVMVGDWSGSGCAGNGVIVNTGADYVYTETCSEYAGYKNFPAGKERACVGMYSTMTALTPPSLTQSSTFVM